jgi:hypothetical protein
MARTPGFASARMRDLGARPLHTDRLQRHGSGPADLAVDVASLDRVRAANRRSNDLEDSPMSRISPQARLARRTGRFPQLTHSRSCVNRPSFERFARVPIESRGLAHGPHATGASYVQPATTSGPGGRRRCSASSSASGGPPPQPAPGDQPRHGGLAPQARLSFRGRPSSTGALLPRVVSRPEASPSPRTREGDRRVPPS